MTEPGVELGLSPTLPVEPGAGAALAAGQRVGEYVVDRPLGAGAMGGVYAGHHPVIGKRVAIKVLHAQLAASADAGLRLVREAQAVNQVAHPGVVDVFAYGRLDDGRTYLVMDLVDGETVRARLRRGPLPPAVAVEVIDAIARALDAAHARGVVHRDLKPDNVMVHDGPPLTVKVLDFGIAKLRPQAGAPSTATLTAQGSWMGTPAYMAPEQWSADGATAASDRYALGVMAYELLTGRPPFQAANVPALMEAHFRAAVPTASGQGKVWPAAVDRVLAAAMAKDPDQRPPTAGAFADDLRAALAGSEVGADAARPGPRRPSHATRATSATVLAGGAVALAAGGLAGYLALAGPGQRTTGAGGAGASVSPGGEVEVLSTPPGALVHRAGASPMLTPARLQVAAGAPLEIEVRKPGYAPLRRQLERGSGVVEVRLTPIVQFEGVWSLPSGELRRFRRDGEVVVAYRLGAADEPGTFYRRFEFVDQGGTAAVWTAEENFVDARAPAEPTCNVPLRAEYVYDPGGDELELRRERVQLELVGGKCVPMAHAWAEPERLIRVVGDGGAWAESRAGGAAPVANAPPAPADPASVPTVATTSSSPTPGNGKKRLASSPAKPNQDAKEPTPTKPALESKVTPGEVQTKGVRVAPQQPSTPPPPQQATPPAQQATPPAQQAAPPAQQKTAPPVEQKTKTAPTKGASAAPIKQVQAD